MSNDRRTLQGTFGRVAGDGVTVPGTPSSSGDVPRSPTLPAVPLGLPADEPVGASAKDVALARAATTAPDQAPGEGGLPPLPVVVRGRPLVTVAPDVPGRRRPVVVVEPGTEPSTTRDLIHWTAVVGGALLVALVVKLFLFQAFMIPSESMVPALGIGDRVLVNKLSYRLHDVHRGDLIVFERPPLAQSPGDDSDLVKRVVGLPGETVEAQGGVVLVDGVAVPERYLPVGTATADFARVTLGPEEVWVMGDNRGNSRDSRVFGPLPESYIIGRAFVRVWPLDALTLF